jgi:hypothetical protein
MKITAAVFTALLLLAIGTGYLAADDKAPQQVNPAFEKMKTLSGEWSSPETKSTTTFRVISGGSALLESQLVGGEGEMVTVYHPDGPNLMGTHYCLEKNQPRFVAVPSSDPNVIEFRFKDVTNLSSPDAAHITGVKFTFIDANHHTEEWTAVENGKEQVARFDLTRKQ